MSVESLFLSASVASLRQCADRIAVCLGKLSVDQIWARGNENENAVGNLILHLCGNARQWMVSGLGGAPDVRVRDREFLTEGGFTAEELTALLRETIDASVAVIETLSAEQLTAPYVIQARDVTGVDAVMSVVRHFAEHTGQIIFATKNMTGSDLRLWGPRPVKDAGRTVAG
jgi:uncharacterized damage-inducible protein DinB